ncbi:MAG: gliding motility-associated protein GldE [Bacteroidota bacterium]
MIKDISFDVIVAIVVVIILIFLSALISGAEVAYFSLSPKQINTLNKNPSKLNKRVLTLLERPKNTLATILIANNFVNVAIIIISTYIINSIFDFSTSQGWGFFIQVVFITFLLLLFSEITPKIFASQHNLGFSRLMSFPLKIMGKFFYPISFLLVRSTRMVDRRFERKGNNISISDLSDALELTDDPVLKEDERIFKGIVSFGNIDASEIMVSRIDMVAIDIKSSLNKVLSIIIESGLSRIPVFDENIDTIKGLLYIKDLLPHYHKGDNFRWQSLIRSAYYVPESKKINDLLEEFRKKKMHMAIVVDEYGGTSGVVTLEDILEEIVGEINDETDIIDKIYTKIDNENYMFNGKTLLNDFNKVYDLPDNYFDEDRGDSDTLAGLILQLKTEMPVKHEIIKYKKFIFTIKAVDERRIKQIVVTLNKN